MCIFQLNIGTRIKAIFTRIGFHKGNLRSAYVLAYAAIKKPLRPHVGSATEENGSKAARHDATYPTAHVLQRGLN
jgi:hypothetical protein